VTLGAILDIPAAVFDRRLDDGLDDPEQVVAFFAPGVASNLARDGHLRPAAFVVRTTRVEIHDLAPLFRPELHAMGAPWAYLRRLGSQPDVLLIGHVGEAWHVRVRKGELPDLAPADHPERVEVVIFMVETRDGRHAVTEWAIERTGGQVRLGAVMEEKFDEVAGRSAGLFPAPIPREDMN
jgi:hypothetical protein